MGFVRLCAFDAARADFLGKREAFCWPSATIPSVYRAEEGWRVLNALGWGCRRGRCKLSELRSCGTLLREKKKPKKLGCLQVLKYF